MPALHGITSRLHVDQLYSTIARDTRMQFAKLMWQTQSATHHARRAWCCPMDGCIAGIKVGERHAGMPSADQEDPGGNTANKHIPIA